MAGDGCALRYIKPPAVTLVEVSKLYRPDFLIEIQAIAARKSAVLDRRPVRFMMPVDHRRLRDLRGRRPRATGD